jgi:hypothetical protein
MLYVLIATLHLGFPAAVAITADFNTRAACNSAAEALTAEGWTTRCIFKGREGGW